jgi:glycosyltransferase involved in cell wall biosynthesis
MEANFNGNFIKMNSKAQKLKIVLDGTVLSMALDNKLARTGVYFVIKNICDVLISRDDVELKIIVPDAAIARVYCEYKNLQQKNCLDLTTLNVGVDKINFLMPFHPANPTLFDLPRTSVFQIIHDFAMHACPELENNNKDFENSIIQSLNPKGYALCVSQSTRSDLIKFTGYPENRAGIFYPGVKKEITQHFKSNEDMNSLEVNSVLNIPQAARYILSLSAIEPRKNLPTALKAFQFACEDLGVDDLYYVITGQHGWGEEIGDCIAGMPAKIQEKIRLTGYLEDGYIPHLYRRALCFLYPSFYEGFGMPPIEAMACGTPVITSDRGSLPEVVGKYAKVLDAYDVQGMGQAIIEWYLNPEMRSFDGERSKAYVEKFTWEQSVQQIISFINSVTSSDELSAKIH